jgi:HEAT repeat protein
MKIHILLLLLVLLAGFTSVLAQAPAASDEKYALQVKPLIQPCEALKDTEDAAITKTSKELPTADAATKIRLAGELGKSCNKNSTTPLTALLQDKEPLVRAAAAEALGQLGNPEAIEAMTELANDPDWRVRFAVGPALCAFQKQQASYAALNSIVVVPSTAPLTEGDYRARLNTALAINQLRDVTYARKVLMYLFTLLEQNDELGRKLATETMHLLKTTRNGQFELMGVLKQSINPHHRRMCANWLGQLKIERSRQLLTEVAANDADEKVKKAAAEALQLLGPSDEELLPVTANPKPKANTLSPKVSGETPPAPKAAVKATPKTTSKAAPKK